MTAKILGAANFYDTHRETTLFRNQTTKAKSATSTFTTWNILGKVKGGFALPIGAHFYFLPYTTIQYGMVFLPKINEKLDKNTSLYINSLTDSFFRLALNIKLYRAKFKEGFGFVVPYLQAGWIKNFTSTYHPIRYQLGGCDSHLKKTIKIGDWEQYMIGIGLSLLHIRGIFVSFDYRLSAGRETTIHFGSLRLGLTW